MMKVIFLLTLKVWFIYCNNEDFAFKWNLIENATEEELLEAEGSALIKYFGKNAEKSSVFLNYQNVSEIIGEYTDVEKTRFCNHDYNKMVNYINKIKKKCPKITHLYSIGKSVQGKELWVLVVSKNPKEHMLLKPEFKYVGNIHGNEATGKELLLLLADLLCKNYRKNNYLTKLVNEVRIHMLFSMNPDGYASSNAGDKMSDVGRNNAQGYDLNRNFPPQFPDHERLEGGEKPELETINFMKWMKTYPFVLSASLHGGSLVANYPFDDNSDGLIEEYAATVDDKLFVQLSYQYARAHINMWKTGKRCVLESDEYDLFYHGITNGAEWYPLAGGMQDWQYLHTNAFDVTIEMSCYKFPTNSMYESLWNHNKYSLITFIDLVRYGIKGIVKSSNGEPLENVKVEIDESKGGKPIFTTSEGEYWRLLAPGKYSIKFSHPDYISKTLNISMEARKLIIENIILTPKEEEIEIKHQLTLFFFTSL